MSKADSIAKATSFATEVLHRFYLQRMSLFGNYIFESSRAHVVKEIQNLTLIEKIAVWSGLKDEVIIYPLLFPGTLHDIECIGAFVVNVLEDEIVKDFWALPKAFDSLNEEINIHEAMQRWLDKTSDEVISLLTESIEHVGSFDQYTTPALKLLAQENMRRVHAHLASYFIPQTQNALT
ncbi:hypothetical protein IT409_01185 [Candidatus Falkowbacteria bacterium]|nr:hypothetical protein [Candidatus Falkowbacteria bacterium]